MGKTFLKVFTTVMLIFCVGCGREKEGSQEAETINSSNEIRVLTSKDMTTQSTHCSTSNGCYLASTSPEHGGKNIFFIDYKTRKKVYLSSSVNGDYWSETDTSYLKDGASTTFCAEEDALYAYSFFENNELGSVIYRMDFDGQNRKEICRMTDNIELVGG